MGQHMTRCLGRKKSSIGQIFQLQKHVRKITEQILIYVVKEWENPPGANIRVRKTNKLLLFHFNSTGCFLDSKQNSSEHDFI